MIRYKLHDRLGGGEMDAYRHRTDPEDSACFYIEGEAFWIPVALLTEVACEPPPGTYRASDEDGATTLAERVGDDWYVTGEIGALPWGALRGTWTSFTPLVPAPEPVKLPWVGEHNGLPGIAIPEPTSDGRVHVLAPTAREFLLSPPIADEMAAALIAAAAIARQADA